jgi:hypothetical protein
MEESIIGRNKLVYIDGKLVIKKQLETIRLYLLNIIIFKDLTLSTEKEIKQKVYIYYLQSCIKYSIELDINSDYTVDLEIGTYQIDPVLGEVIFLFKEWTSFINLIISQVEVRAKDMILDTNPNEDFITLFNERGMKDNLNKLMLRDKLLSTNIFPFKDTLGKIRVDHKYINFFYKILVDISLHLDSKYTKVGQKRYYTPLEINNFYENSLKNLLYDSMPEVVL